MILLEENRSTVRPAARLPRIAPPAQPARATRVLVIAFQGGRQADGGTESLTQLIERYKGPQVTVLSHAETAKTARWRRAGCNVLVWSLGYNPGERLEHRALGGLIRVWSHVFWNLRTAWLALNERIEVAHVNDPHALWHVIAGLRLLGIPTIYNIRDTKPGFSARDRLKWRCAFLLTQSQIVLSREMREFWQNALGMQGPDLTAIYSVVDFQRMHPMSDPERKEMRDRLGLPHAFVVGYVASFSEKKAQLRFIEEAGPQLKRHASVHVYFLGDFDPQKDAYASACARLSRELGLDSQFKFKGYVDRMEKWYPALDAVIVATQNEGLARCMIESVTCGTPVVSFDVCSAREILEEAGCGVVVPRGDYTGLVSALSILANAPEMRARYGRLGTAAARTRFDATTNVARYVTVYETLAERNGAL